MIGQPSMGDTAIQTISEGLGFVELDQILCEKLSNVQDILLLSGGWLFSADGGILIARSGIVGLGSGEWSDLAGDSSISHANFAATGWLQNHLLEVCNVVGKTCHCKTLYFWRDLLARNLIFVRTVLASVAGVCGGIDPVARSLAFF